jgi:hypothetical protein
MEIDDSHETDSRAALRAPPFRDRADAADALVLQTQFDLPRSQEVESDEWRQRRDERRGWRLTGVC